MQFGRIFTTLVHVGIAFATLVDLDSSAGLGKQLLSQEFEYVQSFFFLRILHWYSIPLSATWVS
jgi:hypothetical protein